MSDEEIRKAVEADCQQFFANMLTPDREYVFPIDNVKAIITAKDKRIAELEAEIFESLKALNRKDA